MTKNKIKQPPSKIATRDNPAIAAMSLDEIYADFSKRPGWKEALVYMNEKKFKASDSGASYRTLNHWAEEGLLNDTRENSNGWRQFSLKDIVWIRALSQLREFGLPIEKLRKAYQSVFFLEDGRSAWYLDLAIRLCIGQPPIWMFLVLHGDGEINIGTLADLKFADELTGYHFPYLRICLNTICCEVLGSDSCIPEISPSHHLDEMEESFIHAFREAEHEEISVRLKDGAISHVNMTKTVEGAQRIADLIRETNFGEITFKIADGKSVRTTVTKKSKATK